MWEIYAYQNADSLFGVFNAAAAIHASGDYLSAVAAVAFCGFVAALIAYAFAPEKLQGWKWLATVVLVFSVLIVPKVTVGIVDKTGGSAAVGPCARAGAPSKQQTSNSHRSADIRNSLSQKSPGDPGFRNGTKPRLFRRLPFMRRRPALSSSFSSRPPRSGGFARRSRRIRPPGRAASGRPNHRR